MATNKRTHECYADGCTTTIPIHLPMCRAHWSLVPYDIQREVFQTRKAMKAGGDARPWIDACQRARKATGVTT